jgi:hypothetical protein
MAQTKTTKAANNVETAYSLNYNVQSIKDLEAIDWSLAKDVFSTNKPEDVISLGMSLDLLESKAKFKGDIKISGKRSTIDSLIIKAKKLKRGLLKIAKSYNN